MGASRASIPARTGKQTNLTEMEALKRASLGTKTEVVPSHVKALKIYNEPLPAPKLNERGSQVGSRERLSMDENAMNTDMGDTNPSAIASMQNHVNIVVKNSDLFGVNGSQTQLTDGTKNAASPKAHTTEKQAANDDDDTIK